MLPELYPRAFFAYDFRGCRITAMNPTTRTHLLASLSDNCEESDNVHAFDPEVVG